MNKLNRTDEIKSIISIIPILIILAIFLYYPILNTVFHSFTKWDGLNSEFIGLQNYINLFKSDLFRLLLRNTLVLTCMVAPKTFLSLVVTFVLFQRVRGWKFFRSAFFLPSMISLVVVGNLFRAIFAYRGPINTVLSSINLDIFAVEWFGNWISAWFVIFVCLAWASFGLSTLIFLAGLSQIEESIFESSKLDGANWFQMFFYIVLPMLKKSIEFVMITTLIYYFIGIFSLLFTLTRGGPGYETTTIDYLIYVKAFQSNDFGTASAIATTLIVILIIITKVYITISNREKK